MFARSIIRFCCWLGLGTVLGLAQAPVGSLNGSVHDPSGAVMPGVAITVTNKGTGAARQLVTGSDGSFNATSLAAGAYSVKAEATGFSTLVQDATVQVGQTATLDLVMQVGETNEVVSVQAEAAQIDYDSHEINGVITRQRIQNLPLNGRDFLQLAMLEPGVSVSASNVGEYNQNFNVSILGASSSNNAVRITVDGATVQDSVTGGTQQNFSQEVVQEFQLSSTNFDLSTGIGAGGAINIVTRSGGNNFHGSLFFFYRDHNLSAFPTLAHDPGEPSSPYFARKQEGYWFGGPVKKDKLFFFSSYERTDQVALFSSFPTDPLLFHFGVNADSPSHVNDFTERLDWRISNKHTAFLRYSHDGNASLAPPATGDFPSDWNYNTNWADSGVFSLISVLTPNTANEFRYSMTYWSNKLMPPTASQCPAPCLGYGGPNINIIGVSNFAIGQADNVPQSRVLRRHIFADNITSQKGRHSLKFGGYWEYQKGTGTYAYAQPAVEYLWNPGDVQAYNQGLAAAGLSGYQIPIPSSFNTLQDVLQLPVYGFDIGYSPYGDINQPPEWMPGGADHDNLFHVYFEDTFKLRPRFSLNYGLAWSYESNALNHDITKPAYLAPIFGANGLGTELHSPHNFSPMLGFAWTATSDNKTVVRGGAAIYYDTWDVFNRLIERALMGPIGTGRVLLPDTLLSSITLAGCSFPGTAPTTLGSQPTCFNGLDFYNPQTGRGLLTSVTGNPSVPTCADPSRGGLGCALLGQAKALDPSASNIQLFKTAPMNSLIPQNFRLDYSEHVSLGVERQLRDDLMLSADFVFRQFLHTQMGTDLNHYYSTAGPVIPACTSFNDVLNPMTPCSNGEIEANISGGTSHYIGLLMSLNKRFSHRTSGTLSYAYADQTGFNGVTSGIGVIDLNNWGASYGPQAGHQTLTGSIVVDLPWNFEFSGITSFQSAPPITPYLAGVDLTGSGAVQAGETVGSPLPGIGYNQFNISAGTGKLQQLVGQYNQTYGANLVLPPGFGFQHSFNSQDIRLTKIFKLGSEQRTLSIFGECFNVFNIANLTGYSYALNAPNFGIPTQRALNIFGSGGPRAFQFAARFSF
jgi:Carboxypeptidase regulatory-like domain